MKNKKMNFLIFSIILLFQFRLVAVVEKREEPLSLTISVIIPCDGIRHARHLPRLLDVYAEQTMWPDEVVISVGPIERISNDVIATLNSNKWPFPVKVLYNSTGANASTNRNIATRAATGDIFSYQDSDDLPHPQRIEVLKYLFENYTIDHIMHDYVITVLKNDSSVEKYSAKHSKATSLSPILNYNELSWFIPKEHHPNLGANNSVSITREVFDIVQWNEELNAGEDCFFNSMVYDFFENRILLKNPLYEYFIRK